MDFPYLQLYNCKSVVSKLFLITHTFISKKNFEHVPQYICIPIDYIPVLLYYYVLSEAYEENRI